MPRYIKKEENEKQKRGPKFTEIDKDTELKIRKMYYNGCKKKIISERFNVSIYIINKINFINDKDINIDKVNLVIQMIKEGMNDDYIYEKTHLIPKQINNIRKNMIIDENKNN